METHELLTELLHRKKWQQLKELLDEMNEQDIAELFMELDERDLTLIYRLLNKELAAEVFVNMEPEYQEQLIRAFSDSELREVLDELYVDDAVDLIEEMPATLVKRILRHTDPDTRKSINEILKYPEDSAGSIMTVEYMDLKENMTVEDAIARIRQKGMDSETINICYVLDATRKLVGTVALRYLLISPSDAVIGEIMHENVVHIHTLMDQEEVARQFQKYDFIAMPVVDNEERLVGIITVDDIVDILQEEATEDMEMMAAVMPSDKPYMRTGVWETWKKRFPWEYKS